MTQTSWKLKRDSVFRGDSATGVAQPIPDADSSIIRHILYLEGRGRETPYLSSSEVRETAERFAGDGGRVYISWPRDWNSIGVRHISRKELVQLLVGKGKGDAEWHSAFDVLTAHKYVEEWQEHLADFRKVSVGDLGTVLPQIFKRES